VDANNKRRNAERAAFPSFQIDIGRRSTIIVPMECIDPTPLRLKKHFLKIIAMLFQTYLILEKVELILCWRWNHRVFTDD
jgi:hypothetical protein